MKEVEKGITNLTDYINSLNAKINEVTNYIISEKDKAKSFMDEFSKNPWDFTLPVKAGIANGLAYYTEITNFIQLNNWRAEVQKAQLELRELVSQQTTLKDLQKPIEPTISTQPTAPPTEQPAPHEFDIKPEFGQSLQNNYYIQQIVYNAVSEWERIIKSGPTGSPVKIGFNVTVIFVSQSEMESEDAFASCTYAEDGSATLMIAPAFLGSKVTDSQRIKTIIHELCHGMGFGQQQASHFGQYDQTLVQMIN